MSFLQELQKGSNQTARTANGAKSNNSTLDPVLDFFANAGALRHDTAKAVQLFKRAYAADPLLATRCVFYLRDIRGGQGERAVFRALLKELPAEAFDKNYQLIPEYGRWDEVPINEKTQKFLLEQLQADETNMDVGNPISLLAKWLPTNNTSSRERIQKAYQLAKYWGIKPSQLQKRVVRLRKYIKLLEQQMSSKQWAEIQYDKIPSQAHRKHIKAFKRHDEERYNSFITKVVKGEKKLNSATLFTYEVFDEIARGNDEAAEAMWKNLPDYTNGQNALVLADVSGSMSGRPMSISVSLALYFAERNEGPFKDFFMTFTDDSQLVKVQGRTLAEKLDFIESQDWAMSTNLQSAFDAILDAAVKSGAKQEEMPQTLYIISDMQFNHATEENDKTNLETAKLKFTANGYELPHVVFWNVNAFGNDAPATMYDDKVTLISGSSQSTFRYVLAGKSPLESMHDVLNSERYAKIVV